MPASSRSGLPERALDSVSISRSERYDHSPRCPAGAAAFLASLYGLVLLVPVFEEILWRSFLLRYITDQDCRGADREFSTVALVIVCAAAALSHTEWLVALVAKLTLLWLKRTRSLFAVIVAHAVALLLGVTCCHGELAAVGGAAHASPNDSVQ